MMVDPDGRLCYRRTQIRLSAIDSTTEMLDVLTSEQYRTARRIELRQMKQLGRGNFCLNHRVM
jgi:hypothetical protein